ncbi:aromatic-ring-hydroxylating dioxygenase subunit beta [Nocardioides humi]|uniref:3-phenylpropionate/cinnamic acid dioxygenase subunit beta n=1 Tax=Nocardioides humi TaxID=449461 RepID=A0ABN2AES0_9ACTN|nr:3-phenylpropionate/cinnamic acid dioxygenase subunit beta [Nocardioides humi]
MALLLPPADPEVVASVQHFLHCEALALDERRFRDWLEAFADDAHYEMPVRVTREKLAEWELSPSSRIFDDTKRTLEIRVQRLETDFAWAEQPPSRTRHLITNLLVLEGEQAGEVVALSSCLVYRSRGEDPTPSLFSVARRDRLRRAGGSWQIVHRLAALDQATVNAHNMSIFV